MRGKLINHGSSVARGRKPGNQKEGGGGVVVWESGENHQTVLLLAMLSVVFSVANGGRCRQLTK